ncbi:hypothetical protein K491DRAFT_610346 [Lophiostoma macrostomum CBS 122681]|uniref:Peptidase S28 n=1 Tax=Lophiostoma macrostomum CBS 122681 TaxID=1314788 RepID=A0A6A6SPM1_9PLEO|nr:hypothetical protein K491DRAFT_610346 [Lophiostoma macrostomum CBS 122681]
MLISPSSVALFLALSIFKFATASPHWILAEQDSIATSSLHIRRQTPNTNIEELYVELPIDHNDTSATLNGSNTFWHRYWVDDEFYQDGGPVFIYDVGELDGSTKYENFLTNDTVYFRQLMRNYSGIGIVWEHRYYGNSTPVVIDSNTTAEDLKYLNTQQSLADLDAFARQFSSPQTNLSLTPDAVPWVMTGGSYPAMRAVFMRNWYPDTIYAAFASSAPVEASVDMSFYWDPVPKGMRAYGYGNCTNDIHTAIVHMDKLMEDPAKAAALKVKFLGLGADKNDNPTFADALNCIFWYWQGWGMGTTQTFQLRDFCDYIETDPATNDTAPEEGWAASKGVDYTIDRWASYPKFITVVNLFLDTNCTGSQTEEVPDCDLNKPFTDPSTIAWTWQYCTQWGEFQYYNAGPDQIISKYNDLQHQIDICHRQFPTGLPEVPDTNATNAIFGGWSTRPSNTYWSGGEFDPWRTLSPLSDEPFAPNVTTFTEPPECGVGSDLDEIFGYIMPNSEHEFDITAKGTEWPESVEVFTKALDKWLKCYKPKV